MLLDFCFSQEFGHSRTVTMFLDFCFLAQQLQPTLEDFGHGAQRLILIASLTPPLLQQALDDLPGKVVLKRDLVAVGKP